MSLALHSIHRRLLDLEPRLGAPGRYVVLFSGGLDSTVLLHALLEDGQSAVPVVAVHVDHGLQASSGDFRKHCETRAEQLGIECLVLSADVATDSGEGIEAAARRARYDAVAAIIEPDDWVLSAHHADDQAETLLLNLLRGSGPDGLAAMPDARRIGRGWLVRPLLDLERAALLEVAQDLDLEWIEDPSNQLPDFDRNYLRLEVLPSLLKRWPDAVKRLNRSVERAGDARELLAELGRSDVRALGEPARLSVSGLLGLSPARRRNAVRSALRQLGLPLPPAAVLESILCNVLPAREDAAPRVEWPGAEARRYRDALYLMSSLPQTPSGSVEIRRPVTELPPGLGCLAFEESASGLSPEIMSRGLSVRWRTGGEAIRVKPGGPTRRLKTLLQEEAVVPWLRDRLPLLYANDELVAVADLFLAASATASPGMSVRWLDHPPLH